MAIAFNVDRNDCLASVEFIIQLAGLFLETEISSTWSQPEPIQTRSDLFLVSVVHQSLLFLYRRITLPTLPLCMSTSSYETEQKVVATTGCGVRAESELYLTSTPAYLEIADFF
jgi:hypothetical protein